jgi:hypothetical protein
MLWATFVVLVVLWMLGLFGGANSPLIYTLLIIAMAALIYNLVSGRRAPL